MGLLQLDLRGDEAQRKCVLCNWDVYLVEKGIGGKKKVVNGRKTPRRGLEAGLIELHRICDAWDGWCSSIA